MDNRKSCSFLFFAFLKNDEVSVDLCYDSYSLIKEKCRVYEEVNDYYFLYDTIHDRM